MIKTLIVDDETYSRKLLSELLNKYCASISLVAIADSVNEAWDFVLEHKPDLIFLDVQMPRENGFALLEKLSKINYQCGIIFTTSYDQYALKAFRFSAVDYLLKPINIKELTEAVKKFENSSYFKHYPKTLSALNYYNQKQNFNKICLPTREGFSFLNIENIIWIEADGSYSTLHLTNQKPSVISKPISYFEEIFDTNKFIRVHRSFMVNVDMIQFFNSHNNEIIMTDGTKIGVSTRKKPEIVRYCKNILTG